MEFDFVGKAVKSLRLPTVDYGNFQIKTISAQEGDTNSRYLVVSLFDERGTISLSNYNVATLNAILPNGDFHAIECKIDEKNNCVICKLSGSILSQVGKVFCDVLLISECSDGLCTSLTSQTFCISVSKSQHGDKVVSGDDDYCLLVKMLDEVSKVKKRMELTESEIVKAEALRVQSELERVAAEEHRGDAIEEIQQTKLDKAGADTYTRVYAVDNKGNQKLETIRVAATANAIVQRGADGSLEVPLTPTKDKQATSKVYVDNAIANLLSRIEELEHRVSHLHDSDENDWGKTDTEDGGSIYG